MPPLRQACFIGCPSVAKQTNKTDNRKTDMHKKVRDAIDRQKSRQTETQICIQKSKQTERN